MRQAATRSLRDVAVEDGVGAGCALNTSAITTHIAGNTTPFGSGGAGGLSALSVWWLKLGIEPRYIPPSSPQDNGRHERMHKTLKDETTRPPAYSLAGQQKKFDRFRGEFNDQRPHEALDMTPPAGWYQPSRRSMPDKLVEPDYPDRFEVRLVSGNGGVRCPSGSGVFNPHAPGAYGERQHAEPRGAARAHGTIGA